MTENGNNQEERPELRVTDCGVELNSHDHDAEFACAQAISSVHAFLHGELPEESADKVRHHLMACENCMENFDIEDFITALVKRSMQVQPAPATLRARLTMMHVSVTSTTIETRRD